ncbi:MAG TPA: hypothetical protein VFV67_12835 [Actinophytocola sp.]|uniref:SWIM zinc finger family protein n=1 Tax=Actinophytocola sp. TaxID=1872138 RepID=UPI002DB868A6|nr:hypothetical protein [Actinophytocola sp.]HEU5471531.1 hypothetical protein [Actinophytocola sp.]
MVWFSEVDLRVVAGPASFSRGRDLLDAVASVSRTAEGVEAVVFDPDPYQVFLGPASPGLIGECGCPLGTAGGFCEHCVAAGLVLLAERSVADAGAVDLAGYLRTLPVDELADLVCEVASRDPGLHRKLTVSAANTPAAPQVGVLQRHLNTALAVRGAVDRDGSLEYARTAEELLDTIAGLVESGHAAEARPLARHAVERITESMLLIDDASAVVGAACQRALGLYAWACTQARPNATKLAAWLFQLELNSPGWPTIELAAFADALGDAGLAAYRALVDEAWDNRSEGGDIRRALTLLVMRERLALLRADPEVAPPDIADVLPAELPSPAAFLGVAGRGQASWLAEFLVQAYLDCGRGSDALELRRSQLRATPTREQYAKLKETAVRLERWTEIRPWALDILCVSGDGLVGALLDDGEQAAAWEAAEKYDCSPPLWLEVARLWVDRHPADVLPGYRALVQESAERTGRTHYRQAVALLHELRAAAARCDRLDEFDDFVAILRARHPRKRALLDELTRAGFG